MGTLITFPTMLQSPSPWTNPTIFTPERIEGMGRLNAVARKLRELGYRIIDEDNFPDDDGSPIIEIDLIDVGDRPVKLLSVCAMSNATTGIERVTINGVRVFWHLERE